MTTPEIPRASSLQTRKQAVVRDAIWNAAIDLFHAASFDDVTVDQIAVRAGVSRRTFFRYFSSKEDLMGSSARSYGNALMVAIANERSEYAPIDVAKRAILKVLHPYLPSTERVIQIARQSASARNAQLHQAPMIQEALANAFAIRLNRGGSLCIEDRILASITLFATGLSVEIWVEEKHRPLAEIVEDVFRRLSRVCLPGNLEDR